MSDLVTTTSALARREAALAAIEALTGWIPSVEITVNADGAVTWFHMELQTRAMGGPGTRKIRARMDSIGRCMMEVEEEPARLFANDFSKARRWQPQPLPILLHRRKPEGPRHMLKLVAQYAADNPVGERQPTRLEVLAAAALLLSP
jgi:hypothetical protein